MGFTAVKVMMLPLCLRPWHRRICGFGIVFFGLPGSLKDINVLHRSHLFTRLASGDAPACNYKVNGHDYTMGYYLADDIYPAWATFVKTIQNPQTKKEAQFAKAQEACRKDIERAFGVLQARFAIVHGPARFLGQKNPQQHHDMLCDSSQYDHRG